ncbi:ATP-binding cassette domain-containing protein [Streptomyces sp. SID8366]|uniref:ABC transporter ATP-binding protein n=1 Tax=unclassified Streptomyces TaxID=2593676 RepID=UPI000DBA314C|nr:MULTISPECIES: ABC transporter ATP-binding protein [unclassified Streptomyces]MYU05008.1 ATP-binding cassette domain-containing protein [Streptomyces sp. SID8366]MYU64187.1 ATP-binding cassette domain-containing protein [Streptomyces sp. SID69]RAJ65876.1 putative ABC transport system ATP-binding protein [Streptomyces sp. PsTaAH-130]
MSLLTDVQLPAVQLAAVSKSYAGAASPVPVLREVSLGFSQRAMTAVMGPSGSGKTTLLNCAAGLDKPDSGRVLLGDTDLAACDERELTAVRRSRIGFVFQQFNLLPMLSAYENVALPLRLQGRRVKRDRVVEALREVGLEDKSDRRPAQLSGGQQQRVAIARTLVAEPEIVFADEPTGSLDRSSGRQVMELLRTVVDRAGRTVVMVTHDPAVAACADRVVFLSDGQVVGRLDHPTADAVAQRLSMWER